MKYLFKPLLYAILIVSLFMGGLQAYAILSPGGGGVITPSALCQVTSGVWNFCKTTDVLGNSSNPITNGYFTDLTAVTMAISGTVSGNLSVGGNTTLGDASTDSLTINGITVSLSNGNTTTFNDGTNTLMTLADNGTSGTLTVNTLVPTSITGWAIGTNVQAYSSKLADIAALATTDSNFIVGNGSTWVAEDGTTARTSLGLGSVENTALSTWAGTANITTLGTIGTGSWNATAIDEGKIDWVVTSNVIDFGGATSLEIPNGVNPTINTLGEIALDSSADQLVLYGSVERIFDWRHQKSVSIKSPVDADNFLQGKWQQDITITDIHCIIDPADTGESLIIDIEERDTTGDNPVSADATITCDNDGAEDDGTLSNGAMDANDWWGIDIGAATGTVTQISVDVYYKIDRK